MSDQPNKEKLFVICTHIQNAITNDVLYTLHTRVHYESFHSLIDNIDYFNYNMRTAFIIFVVYQYGCGCGMLQTLTQ